VAPKRDIKQFKQACRQIGIERRQRYRASDDFHEAKDRRELPPHMSYAQLVAWLREWRRD
jgi:hypothetical protein